MKTTMSVGLVVVLIGGLAPAIAKRAPDPIQSRWRSTEMKVDGSPLDWPALSPISKGVEAAVANDADTLQVIVATSDAGIRQRLAVAGLVIYVSPATKKDETFGVRIPPLGGRRPPGEPEPDPDVTYVEILGPSKDDRHILQLPATNGIDAAAALYQGTLDIEVALPLHADKNHPHAPELAADASAIEIGFTTPNPPTGQSGGSRGSYGGGGGGGGRGGGGRGGGGGGRGGAGVTGGVEPISTALKIWVPVTLARPGQPEP